MKIAKKISMMIVTAVASTVLLTGCLFGRKFDAVGYVQSCLDLVTKGETKEYMKRTNSTEEEALEVYNAELKGFVDQLAMQGMPESLNDQYTEFFKKALANSKFEVGKATPTDDKGFEVEVIVHPQSNLLSNMDPVITPVIESFIEQNPDKVNDEAAMMELIYSTMLEEYNKRVLTPEYAEPKTIKAKITFDGKLYTLSDQSMTEIGEALFILPTE